MKKILVLILLCTCFLRVSAQDIPLTKGWKLAVGDSAQWASPTFNDQHWAAVDVAQSWEQEGHSDYNGFGWYRIHIVIPSSLKEKAFLKDSLRINLGSVDDNDEVYLNGKLIGRFGGKTGDIVKGAFYGPRTYTIAANNPAVLWDKENVLAVRVYDTGGDGGIYGTNFSIAMADVMDHVKINTEADFDYGERNSLSKSIRLLTSSHYNYSGKLTFRVTDPETNAVLYEKTNAAAFSSIKPFAYTFEIARLEKKSYTITYTFADDKSGKILTKTETTPYLLTPYPSAKP